MRQVGPFISHLGRAAAYTLTVECKWGYILAKLQTHALVPASLIHFPHYYSKLLLQGSFYN